jgi:(E)-4-hydroxy-3-methylbut-2-enyl-diphosphate synthase
VSLRYCRSPYTYSRRQAREVRIGNVALGGTQPIRVQSMLTCDTMDTEKCVRQSLELVAVGCEIVRITAPTVKDAANLQNIASALRARSCDVPLVADIHFKPEAAMEAAQWVEKVRINPGNYADKKKFALREYTDTEYQAELARLREKFSPLVEFCKEHGIAMRIGTNHGSLSDRIMNRYGDTPLGMVESALEFARIARDLGYHDFVFSMKASNPKIMIEAYRLLVARLEAEGTDWNYPIHLGVTEAGDGEDGRIKSAIGIGSLLSDGIGDTIRVSLTEDSIHEIPVARALVEAVAGNRSTSPAVGIFVDTHYRYDPFSYQRRPSRTIDINGVKLGGEELVRVVVRQSTHDKLAHKLDRLGDYQPEIIYEKADIRELDPRNQNEIDAVNRETRDLLVTVRDGLDLPVITAFRMLAARLEPRHSILLKDTLSPTVSDFLPILLSAATNIGALLCDGIGDAILVQGDMMKERTLREAALGPGQSLRLAYNILQAAGTRVFKTDYVACPSCGRTLFDLQTTTARIKAATSHLKGVKIAIMGCIVNGPGEMADADFGYVGGAPGKVNLYVGKTPVRFNIPESQAVDRLIDLIREHGKWTEPREEVAAIV